MVGAKEKRRKGWSTYMVLVAGAVCVKIRETVHRNVRKLVLRNKNSL